MPSVTYDFEPEDFVYVIDSGAIKSGYVTEVTIEIVDPEPNETTIITYWVNIDGQSKGYTEDVYANCSAASGYDQEVYLNTLIDSAAAVDATDPLVTGSPSATLEASVVIDGGTPIALALSLGGSPAGVTFQDVIDNLNGLLGSAGTASLEENNIRITSATTGSSSTVEITDGGVGSPTTKYFASLNNYTGPAAKVDGNGPGALEALGNQIC